MKAFQPAYITTFENGLLDKKIQIAEKLLTPCVLCPRQCRVDRISGETGICNTGRFAWVSSYNPHFGEEAPLVGQHGSGTIFFTHCNLKCLFCQNFEISHEGQGREVSPDELAAIMLDLQDMGCHNINFVTPSHVVPQLLAAVKIAVQNGLSIPLVYNTGGYDRPEVLTLLAGVFDIYMPDFKFWNPALAEQACKTGDYPEVVRKALMEMHRQVGDLVTDESGIAQKGLLIRHLVLPKGLAGTRAIMKFIADKLSTNSYVNVMSQYRPCGRASEVKGLGSPLAPAEYQNAVRDAIEEGIKRLDQRRQTFVLR